MRLEHWHLDQSPFKTSADVGQFYPSPSHDEALARIEYLVDAQRRLGLLLGGQDSGKSLLLQVAARQLGRQGRKVVLVNFFGLSSWELLWHLAAGLGAAPSRDASIAQLWQKVADRLVENRMQQVDTVLLLDDFGQSGPDGLAQLTRLLQIDPSPVARWTVVVAAEPEQAARWNTHLLDKVDLRMDLRPWNENDTIGYVQTALVEAGRFDPVFDEESLRTIHGLAEGNPGQVVRLAAFALLAGEAAEMERIDPRTVQSAHEELNWNKLAAAH